MFVFCNLKDEFPNNLFSEEISKLPLLKGSDPYYIKLFLRHTSYDTSLIRQIGLDCYNFLTQGCGLRLRKDAWNLVELPH